jgi:hypothetical protein
MYSYLLACMHNYDTLTTQNCNFTRVLTTHSRHRCSKAPPTQERGNVKCFSTVSVEVLFRVMAMTSKSRRRKGRGQRGRRGVGGGSDGRNCCYQPVWILRRDLQETNQIVSSISTDEWNTINMCVGSYICCDHYVCIHEIRTTKSEISIKYTTRHHHTQIAIELTALSNN